jgi:hypothetical protein
MPHLEEVIHAKDLPMLTPVCHWTVCAIPKQINFVRTEAPCDSQPDHAPRWILSPVLTSQDRGRQ